MIKLHLGAGKRDFPGFINVDLADYPHIQYKRNVDDLSPFENESVDLIYSSHTFEYFYLDEVPRVLKEWRRVLKPGGELFLAVPDFENLAKFYQKSGDVLSIQGPLFGFFDIKIGSREDKKLNHKVVYDFKLLKKVLEENGFSDVTRYSWQEFIPTGMEDHSAAYLPPRDVNNGILVSLNVKGKKASLAKASILSLGHKLGTYEGKLKRKIKKIL